MSEEMTTKPKGKKKIKRPKTIVERLELKEAKLRRDLKATLNEISEDTKEHRTTGETRGRAERQKLANRSIIIRSQLMRLQDEIETRNYVTEDKSSKQVRTRIRDRYANAARKHHRLLKMTIELEKLKQDIEDIRLIANDDFGRQEREGYELYENVSLSERRKNGAEITRIATTQFRHSTVELDENAEARCDHLEGVRESLSQLGVETPREKLDMADGLEHKYDFTRELRNLAHEQMLSRHQRNSYWGIIPPYRRKRKKVEHVRKRYVRNFYEDRVDMDKAKKMKGERPKKGMVVRKKEATGFTMSSGETISLSKMKHLTPPGMDLVSEITPIEC